MADQGRPHPATELVLGGQRSGKSRQAEQRAMDWLARSGTHRAVFVATALAADDEMRARIRRHQADRQARLPAMALLEAPLDVPEAVAQSSRADTLVVVDCLTLWLTNQLMPARGQPGHSPAEADAWGDRLCAALAAAPGPVVLVSNELGLGVVPMGPEVRAFVDALGRLNQAVAACCPRVTLMVAGLPVAIKQEGVA